MSLSQLPFEILKDICSYLDSQDEREYADHGHPALCALALTCRRVSDVAVALLYANIELTFNSRDAKDIERVNFLNRSFQENPSLVDRIQSARTGLSYSEALGANDEFHGHLARSTLLTTLRSDLHRSWTALQALYGYRDGSFPQLRDLAIGLHHVGGKEGYLPAEQVARLCELPSLEKLTMYAPVGGFVTKSGPITTMLPGLKHLHFYHSRPVSVAVLESILPRAPNLKCLELSVPGEATENNRMMTNSSSMLGFDLDEPLRPAFLGKLIAPAAASLSNLTIDTVNVLFPSHDGSRIDLSGFTNLSRLELSASLVFDTGKTAASCAWSAEFRRCLPPRIEKLHLLFDNDQGVFWSLGDMRAHARAKTFGELWQRRMDANYVEWLLDFLSRKHEDASSLKTVTISEDPVIDRDQNWKIVQWHMTDRLKDAASAAGVELIIKLRVPRMFESADFEVEEESWDWGGEGTVSYDDDEELEREIDEEN
ncbi:hypothetical protein F4821DRAFT_177701 [Hypoxylon rubiginosum]|uniref:Uncharacterized protein n=1 Tax=Hypoxylon rubiginosum TaxID=110542 RepID=A0ACC0CUF9_9PEZI|nr:hypothetical protein F4821DRAFT_177701 [Hypoxylon rubiginosum]